MDVAHALFHSDSQHVLGNAHRGDRRELSVLLLTAMMRAAGLDWFEQGDVWAKTADLRPAPDPREPEQWVSLTTSAHRLLSADTRPLRISGSLVGAGPWFAAFEQAGTTLADLNHSGRLTRGLRDLIAHHTIFTWNRHGIPTHTQATLAKACTHVIFNGQQPDHPAPGPAPLT